MRQDLGSESIQEIDFDDVFKGCSVFCEMIVRVAGFQGVFNFVQTCWRQRTHNSPVYKNIDYLREQAARCKLLAKGCAPGSASEALTALAAKYSKLATLRADRPIVLLHLQPKKEK